MQEIDIVTLFGQGIYTGTVVYGEAQTEYEVENPVLIFPNGNIEYYETIVYAARKNKGRLAIILEKGGQNCHTVVTLRERNNIIVIHRPEARNLLKEGTLITIDVASGTIRV